MLACFQTDATHYKRPGLLSTESKDGKEESHFVVQKATCWTRWIPGMNQQSSFYVQMLQHKIAEDYVYEYSEELQSLQLEEKCWQDKEMHIFYVATYH